MGLVGINNVSLKKFKIPGVQILVLKKTIIFPNNGTENGVVARKSRLHPSIGVYKIKV